MNPFLFSDPIRQAEQVAKTKLRVFIWIVIHIALLTWGLYSMYTSISRTLPADSLTFSNILAPSAMIYAIGVMNPSAYLYLMYRLLKKLREQTNDNTPD